MSSMKNLRLGIAALVVAVILGTRGSDLGAQVTDPTTGFITSNNWLVLGPFRNAFGCSGIGADLLTLHLAPSAIHCLAPEEGDEVDYDPAKASTDSYTGPLSKSGKPVWRIFDDGSADGDLNMDTDTGVGGDQSDSMDYVVTYVEYAGATPIAAELCVGSDDGVQVWIDQQLVHNNNACRGRGACQDRVPVTISPGFHRIAMGVWERGGGWGGSLGIQVGGAPVIDDPGLFPDWIFYGPENPGVVINCAGIFQRSTSSPSDPNACPPQSGGPLTVTIAGDVAAGGNLAVNERATGPFGSAQITIPGGAIAPTSITDIPQTPIDPSFLPDFQDGRIIKVSPLCANPADNGEIVDNGDGSFTMSNVGEDIWQNGDSFTFLYNRVQGDFVMTVHVADRSVAPSRWGKHGIMARQDLSTRSRYSFIHDQQDPIDHGDDDLDQTRFAARPTHGGNDNFESWVLAGSEHHDYLRLERAGNVVTGSTSLDGTDGSWLEAGMLDWSSSAPAALLVGLAVTSHSTDCANPITITFDEVSLSGTVVPLNLADYPIGVDIAWDAPRTAINAGNVKYAVNVPSGSMNFIGTVGTDPILGAGSGQLIAPITDVGPALTNPDFEHGHGIGAPCTGTSITNPSPGTIVIAGAGNDIWQGGDQFMFAYSAVTGDFSARVTITDRQFAPASRWGKHGIMARQDCGTRSRYSFVHDHGEDLQDNTWTAHRPTHGGADNYENQPPVNCDRGADPACNHANTLRLDRCGNEFITYVLDETGAFGGSLGSWVEIGRRDWGSDAPATLYVGLAVTSHSGCNITTITFEDWELLPTCDAPVSDLTCATNASGGLDLAWTNPPGANTAVPIRIEVDDVEVQSVAGTSTSASIPAGEFTPGVISKVSVINSSTVAAICNYPPEYSTQGFIKNWLILGPLTRPGGPAPGDDQIVLDYLTDGVTTEADIRPKAGDTITPDYNNLASSTGLALTPGRPELNPGGVPTWFEHKDSNDTIDYNADVFKTDINNVVVHAVTYINVETDVEVDIGIGSDDAFHVLIDGVEPLGGHENVARGWGAANQVQSIIEDVPLTAGCHEIMIKVFEGIGGHGFRLRFQDDLGTTPIVLGAISLDPSCAGGGVSRKPGDFDSSGTLDINDPVATLNHLFSGGGGPPCGDGSISDPANLALLDTDGNGSLNISDPVAWLNYLFTGGPPPVNCLDEFCPCIPIAGCAVEACSAF